MSSERASPSDARLVADTLAGDREAFGLLYDRHAGSVRAVLLAVTQEWSAVDDLAQESFLRGYRKLASLDDPSRFRQWISGIARHVARERLRSRRRDRHEFGGEELASVGSLTGHRSEFDDREDLELALRAIRELPERERLAVHAFYLQSRDAALAAESLGVSRSGFYALLQRAIAKLAARLTHRRGIPTTPKEDR